MRVDSQRHRGPVRALEALLRLREMEHQGAKVRLQLKQAEVVRLEQEIALLRKRRNDVIRRGGAHDIKDRLFLDGLMRSLLERKRELEALRQELSASLGAYRTAKSRKEVVSRVKDRRRAEVELALARKEDIQASDLSATRKMRERREREEDPCED